MPREFEIAKEVVLQATPDQVWDSIATEAGLATWSTFPAVDPDSEMVVAWEPGHRLATRMPSAPDGSMHAFEYLIEARRGGGTLLRFVHSGFTGDDWSEEYQAITSAGWDMYLDTLAQYHSHFSGRHGALVVAEGPPSSAVAQAWLLLVAGLGAAAPAELGSEVHIELPGLDPLDGVIDYTTTNFLGMLASDALIRFHGRWGLGMTVAVSHHHYGDAFDVEAARRAWTEWLDQSLTVATAG